MTYNSEDIHKNVRPSMIIQGIPLKIFYLFSSLVQILCVHPEPISMPQHLKKVKISVTANLA